MSGKIEHEFEVQLADGKVVTWVGVDGVDACRRAADCLRVAAVAWRVPPVKVGHAHPSQIIG